MMGRGRAQRSAAQRSAPGLHPSRACCRPSPCAPLPTPSPLLIHAQICDFGYSKHEKYQSAPGSRVGTPAYLAPEVIMTTKGKTYDGKVRGGAAVRHGMLWCAVLQQGRPWGQRLADEAWQGAACCGCWRC